MNGLWLRLTRWTWGLPSLVTEMLSGLLTTALACGLLWLAAFGVHPLSVLVLATALSLVYELTLDANGWSLMDVAEREVGIGLGALLLWGLA
jgi:hypothetical protein